jgi:hypothetical protein
VFWSNFAKIVIHEKKTIIHSPAFTKEHQHGGPVSSGGLPALPAVCTVTDVERIRPILPRGLVHSILIARGRFPYQDIV